MLAFLLNLRIFEAVTGGDWLLGSLAHWLIQSASKVSLQLRDITYVRENFIMLLKKTLLAAAMVALGGFTLSASAGTGTSTSANFQVQITIQSVCTFAAGSGSDI